MTRDPRINPQVGDVVLNKKGILREVHERRGNDIHYVKNNPRARQGKRRTGPHICWITTWQDWCAGGSVIYMSEVPPTMEERS